MKQTSSFAKSTDDDAKQMITNEKATVMHWLNARWCVKKYQEKLCPVEIVTLARDKVPLNNRELFMHRSRIFFQGKRKGLRDI